MSVNANISTHFSTLRTARFSFGGKGEGVFVFAVSCDPSWRLHYITAEESEWEYGRRTDRRRCFVDKNTCQIITPSRGISDLEDIIGSYMSEFIY